MLNPGLKPCQGGFTLIELMIGIVILAILVSLSMPSFQVWLQNSQIRNAAESISNGLQRARSEAVTRNIDVEFVLSGNSSWVVKVAGLADDIESRSNTEGSRNVSVTITPNGLDTITYNGFGGVKTLNLDSSMPFTQIDVDSSVLSSAESQELRVTIGTGGNIRMCDPNAPAGNPRAC
ncbi:MAG: GspH/FimT family pseudopilin [Nitrosomonadales bacterium]|nr:GspH/FimT family pseudopilin [Nitrosomonadales bacterium]